MQHEIQEDDEIVLAILGAYNEQGVPSLGLEARRLTPDQIQLIDLMARAPLREVQS